METTGGEVTLLDDEQQRTRIECQVTEQGRRHDSWGFNRAKHAVLEAAILATRIGILPDSSILEQLEHLAGPVEKTAGEVEQRAFELLDQYIKSSLATRSSAAIQSPP